MRFDVPIPIVSQKLWILEILRISCFRFFLEIYCKKIHLSIFINFLNIRPKTAWTWLGYYLYAWNNARGPF